MIYFDNAATTPVMFAARQASAGVPDGFLGNPSSPHALGIAAERAVKAAMRTLASQLGCEEEEIIFTSGGTEANNLALLGTALCFKRKKGHIITTLGEHPSIIEPLSYLKNEGFTVTCAHFNEWASFLREDTILASLSHVNNETGTTHDLAAAAALVKRNNPNTVIHADGVQGFSKLDCKSVLNLIDLYTLSAHKFHGYKGTGALMARRGVRLAPLLYGGGQQKGLRPGTENVPGILAMAAAAQEMANNRDDNFKRVMKIRTVLSTLINELPESYVNGIEPASPYILNMSFLGIKGETLVHSLSDRGIYISTGAACQSKQKKANNNPALAALGLNAARIESAVRFSFSPMNTLDEAETAKAAVIECVTQLRKNVKRVR
jgi:cysteine desulfurase